MVAFDDGATPADRLRDHAGDEQHLYGHLMRAMADDWEAGGPLRAVLRGAEDAPAGAMVQLRLLAGLFRLVLTGRAPELVRFYPCLGGEDPPEQAWPVAAGVVAAHVDELRDALRVAPQTNEVGRSAGLLAGLADVVTATGTGRVRLLEPGASAGLNLLLDRFHVTGGAPGRPGWAWGDPGSPVRLDGAVPGDLRIPPFTVVERRGCDPHPVDAGTAAGRLLLTSFVWPFQLDRHRRLAAALEVAARHPVRVETAAAGDWLEQRLAGPGDGALDVVWHSITAQYWPAAEVARVRALLAGTGRHRPLARVSLEYADDGLPGSEPQLRTTVWEGTGRPPRERLVATTGHHGVPVRLAAG